MSDPDLDWLRDVSWRGYPRMEALCENAPAKDGREAPAAPLPAIAPPPGIDTPPESRAASLARENEELRVRLENLTQLAAEFERRLTEAGTSYEAAVLEAQTSLREAVLERERLRGELESARTELARLAARDSAHEADLRLERERRADAEKALLEAQGKIEELEREAEALRVAASQRGGAVEELRRQANESHERLLQAKVLTDQDVSLLRQEMRDFLTKFRATKDPPEEKK